MTLTLRLAAMLLTVAPIPSMAADLDVAVHPDLAPEALLPPILSELRRTLRDASSIRELTLCPAAKVKMNDGRPSGWSVLLSFNAKNGFGGYEGVRMYAAVFRNRRLSSIVSTQFGSNDGLSGLVNDMVARKMAACPMIADETVQRLLRAGSSIYAEPVR